MTGGVVWTGPPDKLMVGLRQLKFSCKQGFANNNMQYIIRLKKHIAQLEVKKLLSLLLIQEN